MSVVLVCFIMEGGCFSACPASLWDPGSKMPSPAHSIADSKEVLYQRISQTVVARPGASNHRATSQIEEGRMPVRPLRPACGGYIAAGRLSGWLCEVDSMRSGLRWQRPVPHPAVSEQIRDS